MNSNLQNIDPDINLIGTATDLSKFFTIDEFNLSYPNSLSSQNSAELFLINQNIRSFNANGDKFTAFLHSLKIEPSFLVLTETWNKPDLLELYNISNYDGVHTCRGRGGGVSVYLKSQFEFKLLKELSVCNETIETCTVKVEMNNYYMIIIGIYRPHSGSVEDFILALEALTENPIVRNSKLVLITGDLNINLIDENSSDTKNLISFMQSKHFLPAITKPTRFPSNDNTTSPSSLDHVWINNLVPFSSGIILHDMTDHCPNFIKFNFPFPLCPDEPINICFRLYSELGKEKLIGKLMETDWDSILRNDDVNQSFVRFETLLNQYYCEFFPLKTKTISSKRHSKPWLSPSLLSKIKLKSEYFRLFRRGIISAEINNRFKNQVNKQIKETKDKYYIDLFSASQNDMRRSWRALNELCGRGGGSGVEIRELIVNDVPIVSGGEIADALNDFFASVGTNLEDSLPPPPQVAPRVAPSQIRSFFLFPVSLDECNKIIQNLKITKTSIDYIPVKLFKSISSSIIKPLTQLINGSLLSGVFPDRLKIARITPIFKSGNKTNPSNYRPISSLPFLSKIFETCFKNRLLSFLEKNEIITQSQYGFLRGKNTSDALIDLTEFIYKNLNEKKHSLSVLVDLRKAFDTVNHKILLGKLERCGVRGLGLDWCRSYLSNRVQYVAINGKCSKKKPISIGVPQGSILGPIMFLIYINDLCPTANYPKYTFFADDTTITLADENFTNLINQTNSELELVSQWAIHNRLTINADKTECIVFSNREFSISNSQIKMGSEYINFKNSCKFLGVFLDNKTSFSNHIDSICNKMTKSAGILYRINSSLTPQARLSFYYSFVYPYLSYNISVWGSTHSYLLNSLFITQKRIVRNIDGSPYRAHTSPLFKKYSILKVHDIFIYIVCCRMFNKRDDDCFRVNHNVNTRFRDMPRSSWQRLTMCQKAFSFTGPSEWNKLPESVRNIGRIGTFKKKMREYLISKY